MFARSNPIATPERRGTAPLLAEPLEPRRLFAAGPSVSADDVYVGEGNAGVSYALVAVRLSAPSKQTVTVDYATADGSAVAGSDYDAAAGRLSFSPGQTAKTVRVAIRGDRTPENFEDLALNLRPVKNARVADPQAVVYVVDDEPGVTVAGASANEGADGSQTFTFVVALTAAYDQPVTVSYATSDVGAVAGEDYVATSGTLTIQPGATTAEVSVTVFGDTEVEPTEYFMVTLSNASANAQVVGSAAYGSIYDDDGYVDPFWGYDSDPWSYWPGYYWY